MRLNCRWARRGRTTVQDRPRALVCGVMIVALSLTSSGWQASALEGDEHWRSNFLWPGPGVNGIPSAAIVHDGKLVVGGALTLAGGTEVGRIAQWDGTNWSGLGSGMTYYPGSCFVNALAIYRDTLYAYGNFDRAGGVPATDFAAWDGMQWTPREFAFPPGVQLVNQYLIAGLDDKLYVSGTFEQGGMSFQGLAEWNGASWRFIATARVGDLYILDLALYQGKLVAGGQFTTIGGVVARHIAAWDGMIWSELGGGLDAGSNDVSKLVVYEGELVVAGEFTVAGVVVNIAAWDGTTWKRLGAGTNGWVNNLVAFDGKLIASGGFTRAGGVETSFAQWDGTTWSAVAGWPLGQVVHHLVVFGGDLVVTGSFLTIGDLEASYIIAWDGNTWRALDGRGVREGLGLDRGATSFVPYGEDLLVGGAFEFAGSIAAKGLARWNGAKWSSFGLEADNVNGIAVDGDRIFVCGGFVDPSNGARYNVATWDGGSWRYSNAPPYFLYELIIHEGKLVVMGTSGIHEWDGSSWRVVGTTYGGIYSLFQYDGKLIASGGFTTIGGVEAQKIAQWDGTAWTPLGGGFADARYVSQLGVHDGKLVAAVSGGLAPAYVAVWDGTSWSSLPGMNDRILALTSHEGSLFAGGLFTEAGGVVTSRIARWDGVSWNPMGSGCDWAVTGFGSWKGVLYVGGEFNLAGGRPADCLALWDDTPVALAVSDLRAERVDADVLVTWRAGGDLEDLVGFHVYREDDDGVRKRLTSTLLHGNTVYEHRDLAAPAGSLRYWLVAVDRSGASTWHGPVNVQGTIGTTALLGIWPNPFVSSTRIGFELSSPGPAALDVYDVRGRLVTRLMTRTVGTGRHEAMWDGCASSRAVAPGVYWVRLATPTGLHSAKLIKSK